jgi:hypothetical protein
MASCLSAFLCGGFRNYKFQPQAPIQRNRAHFIILSLSLDGRGQGEGESCYREAFGYNPEGMGCRLDFKPFKDKLINDPKKDRGF